ncbi:MAG: hypothetical protein KGL39_03905 [Patescibacteria group bacterium]|nr:hypothetical protein [Patescibacteria group bacterium]
MAMDYDEMGKKLLAKAWLMVKEAPRGAMTQKDAESLQFAAELVSKIAQSYLVGETPERFLERFQLPSRWSEEEALTMGARMICCAFRMKQMAEMAAGEGEGLGSALGAIFEAMKRAASGGAEESDTGTDIDAAMAEKAGVKLLN